MNVGGEAMELTGEKCHFSQLQVRHQRADPRQGAGRRDEAASTPSAPVSIRSTRTTPGASIWKSGHRRLRRRGRLHGRGKDPARRSNKVQDFSPYVAKIAAAKAGQRDHRQLVERTCCC
ncbi:hypothetical protein ACU4GD_30425 [Cupriavidus basilensis]